MTAPIFAGFTPLQLMFLAAVMVAIAWVIKFLIEKDLPNDE